MTRRDLSENEMEMATFEVISGFEMVRRGLISRADFRAPLNLSPAERTDSRVIHDALAAGTYTIEDVFWIISGAEAGWISHAAPR